MQHYGLRLWNCSKCGTYRVRGASANTAQLTWCTHCAQASRRIIVESVRESSQLRPGKLTVQFRCDVCAREEHTICFLPVLPLTHDNVRESGRRRVNKKY